MRDERIKINSVVQLNENASAECYIGCLMLVTEIKDWGAQGFVATPQSKVEPAARIYLRPKWDAMEFVGTATLVPEDEA